MIRKYYKTRWKSSRPYAAILHFWISSQSIKYEIILSIPHFIKVNYDLH